MGIKEELLFHHESLKNFDFSTESIELLKKHFEEEEKFFKDNSERLGGTDDLSPVGMALSEHKLLLKLLNEGKKELFLELLKYHLEKEERQIYTLL